MEQNLFCPLRCSKVGTYSRLSDKPLTYSRALEIFREALHRIGVADCRCFGLHSLRSGGVTAAAHQGVARDLLKKHGRWATDASLDRYIQDSLKAKLSVTEVLF